MATATGGMNRNERMVLAQVSRPRKRMREKPYAAGVAIKELAADPARVRAFDGVWVPMEATMRHLLFETWTRLVITDLVPNPALGEETFDLGRLESH